MGRGNRDRRSAENVVPLGLCSRIEVSPRAALLEGEPAGLDADRVLLVVPRAVVLKGNGEFEGILLVRIRGGTREGPDGVGRDALNGLEEREAAEGVEEVGQAVLSGAVDATFRLVGLPVAVAVGALKDEGANVVLLLVRHLRVISFVSSDRDNYF